MSKIRPYQLSDKINRTISQVNEMPKEQPPAFDEAHPEIYNPRFLCRLNRSTQHRR
jgi:hypothetical protein